MNHLLTVPKGFLEFISVTLERWCVYITYNIYLHAETLIQ